jgi:oligopeptide transport system substrate-binding protein
VGLEASIRRRPKAFLGSNEDDARQSRAPSSDLACGSENKLLPGQEWAVYLATVKGADTPQIWRLGWCLDYPDANNFIRENFDANGSSNPYTDGEPSGGAFYNNPDFFADLAAAAAESDPAKRVDMYAALEDTLVKEDAVIIPIYWYTRVNVTKPYVVRTFGVGGNELIEKWDILPH